MSIASVMGRIQELEGLISPPAPAPSPTAPAGPNGFAAQLSSAQATAGLGAATPTAPAAGGGSSRFDEQIKAAAARNGVDPALLKGLIRQESDFNPNAGSPAGAQGLCQLMPGTAAALGVGDPRDPAQAIEGGAKYLRQQLDAFGGDVPKALAAYNAGPGAVKRYGGVPPYAETQNYVRQVQAFAAEYRSSFAPSATQALASPGAATLPYTTT